MPVAFMQGLDGLVIFCRESSDRSRWQCVENPILNHVVMVLREYYDIWKLARRKICLQPKCHQKIWAQRCILPELVDEFRAVGMFHHKFSSPIPGHGLQTTLGRQDGGAEYLKETVDGDTFHTELLARWERFGHRMKLIICGSSSEFCGTQYSITDGKFDGRFCT